MNRVDEIYEQNKDLETFAKQYVDYLSTLLASLDFKVVGEIGKLFLEARNKGRKIIFIGNGGSAATASHFANDFSIGTRCPWKPFKAMSLTDNVAVLTCIGNDFGYNQIFRKQLETTLEGGDLLVLISASGNSENLVEAVRFATERGNTTIGLLGFDGGKLSGLCTKALVVKTRGGEYGPVEDVHMILDHLISSYFIRLVRTEK